MPHIGTGVIRLTDLFLENKYMASKIVYHGTLSEEAPHEHGYPFHAGTSRAANERLDDEIQNGVDWGEATRGVASIHAYEVSDTAPTSRRVWQDPMFGEDENKFVPEHKENRIYPYKNDREDRGSTSYVIPSNFVGKHVKHLGVQFQQLVNPYDGRDEAVYNAMSTMSGGKYKP